MMGGRPPATIDPMSSTTRFTWLVLGAVAVTLVLAAAVSAAMDSGNALPALAHAAAVRAATGGQQQSRSDGVSVPPAAAVPDPEAAAGLEQDEPEPEPVEDLDRDRDRGHSATSAVVQATGEGGGSSDRHGSDGGGRDGGRG
jgi:uncharacterized membrane protein YgcG